MLSVEVALTEYANERGEPVKAAQDVTLRRCRRASCSRCSGPRGCGKTTTLRSIAGLEQPTRRRDRGRRPRRLFVGARASSSRPNQRGFGMVFQSYAIWPHMTVFENVAFPLEVGGQAARASEIRDQVMRVLDAVAARPSRRPPRDQALRRPAAAPGAGAGAGDGAAAAAARRAAVQPRRQAARAACASSSSGCSASSASPPSTSPTTRARRWRCRTRSR